MVRPSLFGVPFFCGVRGPRSRSLAMDSFNLSEIFTSTKTDSCLKFTNILYSKQFAVFCFTFIYWISNSFQSYLSLWFGATIV